jgi:cytochrome P450 family 628
MRLHASVTTGGSRMTPREGLQVGHIYIPGDVNMVIPPHALHLGKSLPFLIALLRMRE